MSGRGEESGVKPDPRETSAIRTTVGWALCPTMYPFICYALLALALLLGGGTTAQAQQGMAGVSVPVKIWVEATGSGTLSANASFLESAPGTGDGEVDESETIESNYRKLDFGRVLMEPGVSYPVSLGLSESSADGYLTVSAPSGYRVQMDGMIRSRIEFGSYYTAVVRLLPLAGRAPSAAGTNTHVARRKIDWRISLGNLLNGDSAGELALVDASMDSHWGTLYTPAALQYESPSDEIGVHRVNNVISRITTNDTVVEVDVLGTERFKVSLYTGEQALEDSTSPYLSYLIEPGDTPVSLRITREARDVTDATGDFPVVQTHVMMIERSGSWPQFNWFHSGWTRAGEAPLVQHVLLGEDSQTLAREEHMSIGQPGRAGSALKVSFDYKQEPWGEVLTQSTLGTTDSATTSYTYHDDLLLPGSWGNVKAIESSGGSWQAFDYFAPGGGDSEHFGVVKYRLRPYGNQAIPVTLDPAAANLEVTEYNYEDDIFGYFRRPTLIETKVNQVTTAKSTISYNENLETIDEGYDDLFIMQATRRDYFTGGGNSNLRTVTKFIRKDQEEAFFRGKTHSVENPDGVKTIYAYQYGQWSGTNFNLSYYDGTYPDDESRITVITGTSHSSAGGSLYSTHDGYDIDDLYLIANQSTMIVTFRNERARVFRTEQHIWDGSAWVRVDFIDHSYNYVGQLISSVSANGATTESTYTGTLRTSSTDETGIVTTYTYDAAGRVASMTREGVGVIAALTTTYAYDALGNALETVVGAGQIETLRTSRIYDDAGRLISEQAPGLDSVLHTYNPTERSHAIIYADGTEKIETLRLDGRLQKIEGSAVVPAYHNYGVETDGRRWTQNFTGGLSSDPEQADPNSPRWTKSWTDWLGRNTRAERPGFDGAANWVEEQFYQDSAGQSATGKLIKSTVPTRVPSLVEYGPLGQAFRSGLDLNENGSLDLSSTDRITETETLLELDSGAYWMREETRAYPYDNNATMLVTGVNRTRLTAYATGQLSETRTIDAEGNTSTESRLVDRSSSVRSLTTTSSRSGMPVDATQVLINGLPHTVTGHDGLTTSSGYDTLQRPVQVTDSRSNTSTTTYYPGSSQVSTITDAAGNISAAFGYDRLGRTVWQRDALNHVTRQQYSARGQLYRKWGDATYPVEYLHDGQYGERTLMSTFRERDDFDGEIWPVAASTNPTSNGDETEWTYDPATGWLMAKTDAHNHSIIFGYCACGKIATTTSARGITRSHVFDSDTNELLQTNYTDGTPGLSYTYDRLGQVKNVSDATGTRSFDYDTTNNRPWRLASETSASGYFGDQVLTPLYDNTTIKGRSLGFQLGTTANRDAYLEQSYGYLANGRFETLHSQRDNNSIDRSFRYAWRSDAPLIAALSIDGAHPFTVTRAYESQRNLVTSIETKWSTATRTAYAFAYDARGQRSSLIQSGDIFDDYYDGSDDAITRLFTYNGRGEVTADVAFLGDNPTDQSRPLHGRREEFTYDSIGNRQSSNRSGVGELADQYTTNALNQYVTRENNTVALSGTADTQSNGVNVLIAGRSVPAGRQGRHWNDEITVGNEGRPWQGDLTVYTAKPGAGAGGADLLRSETREAKTAADSQGFSYDDDGNILADGVWNYTWDAENRLTSMESDPYAVSQSFIPTANARRLEFAYDYLGRRVEKLVRSSWNGTSYTTIEKQDRYVYEGWNLIAEYAVTNPTTPTLILKRSYTWGLDIVSSLTEAGGVGALLQITDHATGQDYLPAYDGNGNVTALLAGHASTGGAVAAAYEYGTFGELIRNETSDTTMTDQPFRFSTKFTDMETGLVYYGRRYYDPKNGRFLGRDPINEEGGLNLYSFVGNNPVNAWDYLGMNSSLGEWEKLDSISTDEEPCVPTDFAVPGGIVRVVNCGRSGTSTTFIPGSGPINIGPTTITFSPGTKVVGKTGGGGGAGDDSSTDENNGNKLDKRCASILKSIQDAAKKSADQTRYLRGLENIRNGIVSGFDDNDFWDHAKNVLPEIGSVLASVVPGTTGLAVQNAYSIHMAAFGDQPETNWEVTAVAANIGLNATTTLITISEVTVAGVGGTTIGVFAATGAAAIGTAEALAPYFIEERLRNRLVGGYNSRISAAKIRLDQVRAVETVTASVWGVSGCGN